MDLPIYRQSRLLYPLLARLLAFGDTALVPATLLVLNLGAVVLGTLAAAALLRRRGVSPWWGLLFAGYPGVYLGVAHDLSEPLAYALVAAGLYALDRTGVARPLPAAVLLGLAAVARETTLVFPAVLAACAGLGLGERGLEPRRWRAAATMAAVALLPYVAVRSVLRVVYGEWLEPVVTNQLSFVPFESYRAAVGEERTQAVALLLSVLVPGLLATGIAGYAARAVTPSFVLVAANVLLFVTMVPAASLEDYLAAGRIATGAVVAFLAALPSARRTRAHWLVWLPIVLWLLPWPFVGEIAKPT